MKIELLGHEEIISDHKPIKIEIENEDIMKIRGQERETLIDK